MVRIPALPALGDGIHYFGAWRVHDAVHSQQHKIFFVLVRIRAVIFCIQAAVSDGERTQGTLPEVIDGGFHLLASGITDGPFFAVAAQAEVYGRV